MKIRAVTSFLDPARDVSSSLKILSTCSAEIKSAINPLATRFKASGLPHPLFPTGFLEPQEKTGQLPFGNWLHKQPASVGNTPQLALHCRNIPKITT